MNTVRDISAILGLFLLVLLTADVLAGWAKQRNAPPSGIPNLPLR